MAAQSAAALERKREENIAKKEAERKQKIQEIKQRKAELKLQREEHQSLKQTLEREEELRRLELAKKREENIKAREAQRKERAKTEVAPKSARGHGTKYSKSEILMMKEVFDSYDTDGSGEMTVSELKQALHKYKEGDRTKNSTLQNAFMLCEPVRAPHECHTCRRRFGWFGVRIAGCP
uniref:EF-hand domain-containing protein n=1 Tax=Chrysotila carterae TaxID=13221 RepID=A0A7S4ESR7_CHRCT